MSRSHEGYADRRCDVGEVTGAENRGRSFFMTRAGGEVSLACAALVPPVHRECVSRVQDFQNSNLDRDGYFEIPAAD